MTASNAISWSESARRVTRSAPARRCRGARWRWLPFIAVVAVALAGCSSDGDELASDQLHVSCLERPDAGPCRAYKAAFYYDYKTDSCRQFAYGGCAGHVPFETMKACVATCGGQASSR